MTDSPIQLGPTEVSPDLPHRSPLLKSKMSGLDALRGIAVLSVFLRHAFSNVITPDMPPGLKLLLTTFRFGWLGVDLFFVLSGFLITGILLDTRHRPDYYRNFYTRRALRILPLYLAVLILIRLTLHVRWSYLTFCLFFLANLVENRGYVIYNPLWSLAVEEQFYLLWPTLVRRLQLRTLTTLCLASIILSPILRYLATTLPLGNPYDATWLITDALSLGALLAVFLRSRYATPRNTLRLATLLLAFATISGIAAIPLHLFSRSTRGGTALQTEPFLFFFGFLLLAVLHLSDKPILLRLTLPLRFYGYLAYGLYLLHQLAFMAFDALLFHYHRLPPQPTAEFLLLRCIITLTLTTLVCLISRRYFEDFFLRFKDRLAPYTHATLRS
jgi:peptidoglycan/LPS O-acetylase OafA/YrhL